jgi:hypothetical protein
MVVVQLMDPRQHVNFLEIEAINGGRFDMLVDGQLFGPFYKARITPHTDERSKKQIVFPIQTFFPLDNIYA